MERENAYLYVRGTQILNSYSTSKGTSGVAINVQLEIRVCSVMFLDYIFSEFSTVIM